MQVGLRAVALDIKIIKVPNKMKASEALQLITVATDQRKKLAQYYTDASLGQRLVSMLPPDLKLENVVDLGVGEGALLFEISKKYPDAKLYGSSVTPE